MLRNYQINAINSFEGKKTKNAMLCMATGSGKTYTFCEIAKRHHAEHATRVLILVHRQELLQQAYDSLGAKCFKIEKGVKFIPGYYNFYVGMVETVNRRLSLLPELGLVIIDEAHIGNFKKMPFFTEKNCQVLGVTATPISEKPLAFYYQNLIIPITISDLIKSGYLVNCDVYGFASDLVTKQKFKTTRGEFDEKQMQDFYSSEKMVKNVINAYWTKAAGKKTIIFNVNVNHNKAVFDAMQMEGLNVMSITGETEKNEREKIISKYKKEKDAVICNVGVLTTGFDAPDIECVILNRATKSLGLYLQMIGRGARTYEGKEKFTVLDLGGNTNRHGFYDHDHDWHKYFTEGSKKEKGEGAAPTKECPECGFVQHTRKIECENCGHNFEEERKKQQKEEKEKDLFLLIRDNPVVVPLDYLFTLADERGWKPYAVLYKISEHLVKYQKKHIYTVTDDYIFSVGLENLEHWCKKYDKKNNNWHQKFLIDSIKTKQEEHGIRIENTAGNSNIF